CLNWKACSVGRLPLPRPCVVAGALLCFIPIVGEFVIPDLLGSSQTMMIGQTLWAEFFANRDWPVASAVAVVLLCLLVIPIVFYEQMRTRDLAGGRCLCALHLGSMSVRPRWCSPFFIWRSSFW